MKLVQITEMAAKKLCDRCGKTMAANHYWYKGGWRCKKSALSDVESSEQQPQQTQTAAPAAPADVQQPKEPTVPVSLKEIEALVPEVEWNDMSDIKWSVTETNGNVTVTWTYPFTGVSAEEAFMSKARQFAFGNVRLRSIASKFPTSVVSIMLPTIELAKQSDMARRQSGHPVQTSDERRIGGELVLLSTS